MLLDHMAAGRCGNVGQGQGRSYKHAKHGDRRGREGARGAGMRGRCLRVEDLTK